MVSEVLKVFTTLDASSMSSMQKNLSGRFTKIAKGFGNALKVASVAALGAAVLDKLINPLNEVKAAIDRTLGKADDVVTNARQFNTTTENLLKIRALGSVRGLSGENVDLLLTKFQTAVANAKANPADPSNKAVLNYVNEKDTALAFYNFITQLQKLDKNQQLLVQENVFGEKQVLKMAEFLQDTEFKESAESLKNVDFSKAAVASEQLARLNDKNEANKTVRDLTDLSGKAKVIKGNTIENLNHSELKKLQNENARIAASGAGFTAEEKLDAIQVQLEKLLNQIITNVPELMNGLTSIITLLKKAVDGWTMIFQMLRQSPLMRGVKGLFGGGSKDE